MADSSDSAPRTFRTSPFENPSKDQPFSESGIVAAGLATAIAFHCGVLLNLYAFEPSSMLLALLAFMAGSALSVMVGRSRALKGTASGLPAAAALVAVISAALLLVIVLQVGPDVPDMVRYAGLVIAFLLLGCFLESDIVTLVGYERNLKSSLKRGTVEKAFIAAALLAFAVSLFSAEFRLPAMVALALATSAFTFAIRSRSVGFRRTAEPLLTSSKDYYLNRQMAVLAIIISAALAFCFVAVSGIAGDLVRCISALALGLAAAVLLAFARFRHLPQFSETISIALVSAVLCLVLLPADASLSTGIVFIVTFVMFEVLLLMTMIGTMNTIDRFHLDFASYFLTSRGRYLLGFLCGAAIGIGAANVPGALLPIAAAFGLAIAAASASVIAPLGTRTAHGVLKQGFEETKYVDDCARDRSFEQSCASIGERFGLTERELEVFAMLAQGLNVPVIAEKLVVSESTVKSHSANIYKKCHVHSKQQIIAMVSEDMSGGMPRRD